MSRWRRWLGKFWKWLAGLGIVGLVGLTNGLLDIGDKLSGPETQNPPAIVEPAPFIAGTIKDGPLPLPGVTVILPAYNLRQQTNENGYFYFDLPERPADAPALVAQKEGYKTRNVYAAPNDRTYTLQMKKLE